MQANGEYRAGIMPPMIGPDERQRLDGLRFVTEDLARRHGFAIANGLGEQRFHPLGVETSHNVPVRRDLQHPYNGQNGQHFPPLGANIPQNALPGQDFRSGGMLASNQHYLHEGIPSQHRRSDERGYISPYNSPSIQNNRGPMPMFTARVGFPPVEWVKEGKLPPLVKQEQMKQQWKGYLKEHQNHAFGPLEPCSFYEATASE